MKERLCRIIQNWDVITKTCQQITFEKRGWNIPFKEKNPCKDLDEGNGVFSSRNKDAFDFSKQLWPVLAPNHHTNESCVHKKNHQFSWLLNRAPYNDLIPHITGYFFSPVYPFFIAHIITARNCPIKPKCVETTKRCFFLGVVAFCTMPSPMGRGRSTKGETLGDTYFGRKMAKVAHFFRQTRRKKKQVIELNHKHISRLHWLIESTSTLLARKPENPPKKHHFSQFLTACSNLWFNSKPNCPRHILTRQFGAIAWGEGRHHNFTSQAPRMSLPSYQLRQIMLGIFDLWDNYFHVQLSS